MAYLMRMNRPLSSQSINSLELAILYVSNYDVASLYLDRVSTRRPRCPACHEKRRYCLSKDYHPGMVVVESVLFCDSANPKPKYSARCRRSTTGLSIAPDLYQPPNDEIMLRMTLDYNYSSVLQECCRNTFSNTGCSLCYKGPGMTATKPFIHCTGANVVSYPLIDDCKWDGLIFDDWIEDLLASSEVY